MTQKNGMRAAEVDRQALEAVADMLDDWHAEGGDPLAILEAMAQTLVDVSAVAHQEIKRAVH